MNILILGGTGAIGKALVQELNKEKKYNIFVTSRKNNNSKDGINYIQGNAHDEKFLKDIIESNDFEAIVDFMVYDLEEFSNRVDFFLNNTKQYIFLSSARVYSDRDDFINENTPRLLDVCEDKEYIVKNEYALEKAREENCLLNNDKKNWTIIRPYITYNNNRLQLGVYEKEEWLYRILKGKKIVIPSKLFEKTTTLTYGVDVSKYISKLILNEKALGQTFQIVSDECIKWKDVFDLYKEILNGYGYNAEYVLASEKQDFDLPINKYQLVYDRYYNRRFKSNKLKDCINEEIQYQNINMLKESLKDFLDSVKKDELKLSARYTGMMDKISKEKTSLREFDGIKEKIKYILARYTSYFNIKK